MVKRNRVETQAFVVRVWREGGGHGKEPWRGTLIHPTTNRRIHFETLAALVAEMSDLLEDIHSIEGDKHKG
jgi:hypothetical protein